MVSSGYFLFVCVKTQNLWTNSIIKGSYTLSRETWHTQANKVLAGDSLESVTISKDVYSRVYNNVVLSWNGDKNNIFSYIYR